MENRLNGELDGRGGRKGVLFTVIQESEVRGEGYFWLVVAVLFM